MKIKNLLIAISAIITLSTSCIENKADNTLGAGEAKYIFYFIGDGMSSPQIHLTEAALGSPEFRKSYAKYSDAATTPEQLFLSSLDITGLATTFAENRYITDSAAAGTALATGSKTDVGVIAQSSDGKRLTTIAERAKASGMKVGILSSVSIDHATPASFYAHEKSRNNYASISDQLLTSSFDYFAGGSVKFSSRAKAADTDMATAYAEYRKAAESKGYKFINTREGLDQAKSGDKVIATLEMLSEHQYAADGFALPYTIDRHTITNPNDRVTLAEYTKKGIELLDNEDGFFMMVEGGKIDWACHSNDAVAAVYELIAFDEAIGVALDFAAEHPDETLIVVTGDHETGGLTLGYAGTYYESAFEILAGPSASESRFAYKAKDMINQGASFDKMLSYACSELGFTNDKSGDGYIGVEQNLELTDVEVALLREAYLSSKNKQLSTRDQYHNFYGGGNTFAAECLKVLNNKAGIDFSSFSHTALPVMVFAHGAGAELFNGYYDNTDIPKRIASAGGF